jgi:hypothetical protein
MDKTKIKLAHVALIILLIITVLLALQGCAPNETASEVDTDSPAPSMFIEVEHTTDWRVVYHKDTRVMYAVSSSSYNYGTFTLLVDADGKPLIYAG